MLDRVRDFLRGEGVPYVVISDIHWGSMPPDRLYDELSIFKELIKEIQNGVYFINGDYFHMKLNGNSKHLHYALSFMSDIIRIAEDNNCAIRIIKGTESHDEDQLEILRNTNRISDVDVEIFDKAIRHEVKGLDVLFLPEEYHEDSDAVYKPLLEEKYDFIMGHGMLDIAGIMAQKQETEVTRPDITVFDTNHLCDITNGYIYFGHVHTPMIHKNARYTGSYSIYGHGEEHAKGFYLGLFNTKTKKGDDIFIENTKRRIYRTFKIDNKSELFKKPPFEIVETVLALYESNNVDAVRFKVNIPDWYESSALLARSLTTLTNRYRSITMMITQGIKEKELRKEEEKIKQINEKFGKIFHNNIPVEERLSFFIKQKHQIEISADVIKKEYM